MIAPIEYPVMFGEFCFEWAQMQREMGAEAQQFAAEFPDQAPETVAESNAFCDLSEPVDLAAIFARGALFREILERFAAARENQYLRRIIDHELVL